MAPGAPRTQAERLQFLQRVAGILRRTRADDHLARLTLREAAYALQAEEGLVLRYDRFTGRVTAGEHIGRFPDLGERVFLDFVANRRPKLPAEFLLAPIRIGLRPIGILALHRTTPPFTGGSGRFLARLTRVLSDEIERRSEAHLRVAFEHAALKALEEGRPQDLAYRMFHDLRARIRYDHSAGLLRLLRSGRLVLVAEQVAFRKGKSASIDRRIDLDAGGRKMLERATTQVVAVGPRRTGLARALAKLRDPHDPPERLIVLHPLVFKGKPVGLLKIATCGGKVTSIDAADRRTIDTLSPILASALARWRRE